MSDTQIYARPQIPLVVWILGGAIVLAFLGLGQFDDRALNVLAYNYGIIPARFSAGSNEAYAGWDAALIPLIGHVFVHAGWLHLFMNMIAYLQGSPFLAARLGAARFLLLFFLSGIGGAAAFILINPHTEQPMVGASGAICGLFGAYFLAVRPTPQAALADPQVRNAMLMFLGINVVLVAVLPLPIAWEAHLGGFIVGALVYLALAPRHQRHGPWG